MVWSGFQVVECSTVHPGDSYVWFVEDHGSSLYPGYKGKPLRAGIRESSDLINIKQEFLTSQ